MRALSIAIAACSPTATNKFRSSSSKALRSSQFPTAKTPSRPDCIGSRAERNIGALMATA